MIYNLLMLIERGILKDIARWLPREEIIILTGPRQSGKTALLKIIEKKLAEKGETVNFFNFEGEEILAFLNHGPANLLKLVPIKKTKRSMLSLMKSST